MAELFLGNLEGHHHQRRLRIGVEPDGFLLAPGFLFCGGLLALQGGWQVAGDRIEQGLNPLVFERRPHIDGNEGKGLNTLFHTAVHLLLSQLLPLQIFFHGFIVKFGDLVQHLGPHLLHFIFQLRRTLFNPDVFPIVPIKVVCLAVDQIHYSPKILLFPYGYLHENRIVSQFFDQGIPPLVGIGPHPIHFVEKSQARHPIAFHLAIHRDGLGLNSRHGTEDQNGSVQNPQGTLHLHRKVHVAGSIDDIDPTVLADPGSMGNSLPSDTVPKNGGGGGGDGDSLFLLQLHVIHFGTVSASPDILNLVDFVAVKKHPLGEGGLARIDVGGNADIAGFGHQFHDCSLLKKNFAAIVPHKNFQSMEKLCYSFRVRRTVCLFLLLFPISPSHAESYTPLGVGIFPGILSPPAVEQSVIGIRISPLVGIHRDVHGLDVGVVNVALGNVGAAQLGLFNYQARRMTIFGLQLGALANWNAGHVSGFGIQLAGLINRNADSGYFFGIQGAPANLAPKTNLYGASLGFYNQNGYLRGFQVGAFNDAADLGGVQLGLTARCGRMWGIQSGLLASQAGKITGIQVGLFNMAGRVTGLQLGLLNRAESLRGIQIGLINLNTGGPVPFFPLINIGI